MGSATALLKFDPTPEPEEGEMLGRITSMVENMGDIHLWGDGLTYRVNLVLEELAVNILSYGRIEGEKDYPEIEIKITSGSEALEIQVADNGTPFNPLEEAPVPVIPTGPDDEAPMGGLGIHLVKNMVDDISYSHRMGRNEITIKTSRDQET